MNEQTVTLDVRDDIGRGQDPFTRIMGAVAGMQAGDKLLLYAPFKPTPLLHVMTQKGYSHQAKEIGGGDWQVLFERSGEAVVPPGQSAPCGCTAVPVVVEVDARGLEPPGPMMKILESLAALPPGAEMKAHTDRRPLHLFEHLEYRGFAGETKEQNDGSFITHIYRC